MPSKRSWFNRTLFLKHLARFWPLWGVTSLAGAMVPLYLLLALLRGRQDVAATPREFACALYQFAAAAPALTACYAILCAMAVWGYLYNSRSVGLLHALPADRDCLFATNALAGLAMLLLPCAVTGGLLCLVALCWGFLDLPAAFLTALSVVFLALLFFGMASLCAMLTGHAFVLPVFYLLLNFLVPLLEQLAVSLAEEFLLGVSAGQGFLDFLSPLIQITRSFDVDRTRVGAGPDDVACSLRGLWVVALYALAGLAMLALARLLYKRRHSESAGDVVAFRWLRPVFQYGLALLSGLTLGRAVYELLWGALFQRGDYADVVPMWACVSAAGIFGWYAAAMLLEKSLRVFRGSWRGAAIVCAGAAALCLLVSVDVFGVERRVPRSEEIESVVLYDRGMDLGPFTMEDGPEEVEGLRRLHQAIVDGRDYIRACDPRGPQDGGDRYNHVLYLEYRLKDGTRLARRYDLWVTEGRAAEPGTYDSLLAEFYRDPAVRRAMVAIPDPEGTVCSVNMFSDYAGGFVAHPVTESPGDARAVYGALLRDADEGRVPARDVLSDGRLDGTFWLQLEWRAPAENEHGWSYHYKDVYLYPEMTATVDALVGLGYMTEEEAAAWAGNAGAG